MSICCLCTLALLRRLLDFYFAYVDGSCVLHGVRVPVRSCSITRGIATKQGPHNLLNRGFKMYTQQPTVLSSRFGITRKISRPNFRDVKLGAGRIGAQQPPKYLHTGVWQQQKWRYVAARYTLCLNTQPIVDSAAEGSASSRQ